MKPSTTAIITAAGASSASAMAPLYVSSPSSHNYPRTDMIFSFNTTSTQAFRCPMPFGLFCAGPSMSQNLVMKCELGMPSPINCIEHTAAQLPLDDYNARCFESAPTAGDAGCAKEGTVYPLSGKPFPLPAGSDDSSLPEIPSLTASAGATTMYPSPASLTAHPMPTAFPSLPADIGSLPKASLPGYVTTVTMGTTTRWHTVFSNCGNGTMLYGTATASSTFASWQTGSIPGELHSSKPQVWTSVVPNTVPCQLSTSYAPRPSAEPSEPTPTSSETSTVSWAIAPTETTGEPSWVHPTDYATVTKTAPASSLAWSSGAVAAPTSAIPSSESTSSSAPSEYPSAMSSGFDSGEDSSSSAAGRGQQAPSSWLLAAAMAVVLAWAC